MDTVNQTETRTLALQCRHDEVDRLHRFLRDTVREIFGDQANREWIGKILLAVHEAFTNVVRHAYSNGKEEGVLIHCTPEEDGVVVEIVDHGVEFNPLELILVVDSTVMKHIQRVDDLKNLDEEEIAGGYGIPIIQATATSTKYWRSESGDNHLYMYFKKINF